MLLEIPFHVSSELLKYKSMPQIFKALSSHLPLTASELMRQAQTSWSTVWTALRLLERTEYVKRSGRNYVATDRIRGESFILNLRDFLADELFRWKATRAVLYQLYMKPESSLRELAQQLGASYETVRAIMRKARKLGLVQGQIIKNNLIINPTDPVELVPRAGHREAIRHFISALKTYYPDFSETIVLFGDASWGKQALELDLMAVVESPDPDAMFFVAKKLVYASENVTANYGAKINLAMMARYVWPEMKLDIVDYDNPALRSVIDGICVYGELPKDDEFFELGRALSPWPEDVIREKLEKGYLKPVGDGKYVYTEKAIKVFREKRSKVVETQIYVSEKKVRLIGVAPPYVS
jgi:DNA-binding Lrp family transcriptional regulator